MATAMMMNRHVISCPYLIGFMTNHTTNKTGRSLLIEHSMITIMIVSGPEGSDLNNSKYWSIPKHSPGPGFSLRGTVMWL